ncbi:MAG: hypothetical protein IIX96_02190 [Clostridia bacterium]|nr:hypothetical protein [Clostridia bacterium]
MHDKVLGASLPSPLALAFLGDSRYSLFIRRRLLELGVCKSGELNKLSQKFVSAEAQSAAMNAVEPILLDDEREIYKRASNSTHLNKPKHAKGYEYRRATGFEAVVGMLEWLGDGERLEKILDTAYTEIMRNDTEN